MGCSGLCGDSADLEASTALLDDSEVPGSAREFMKAR